MSEPTITPHRLLVIAVAADTNPRTVKRVIEGKPTRPSLRERIEKALRAEGLGHLVKSQ